MPEVSFGVYCDVAGPATQVRLSSRRPVRTMLTVTRIDGRKAAECGLVSAAVPVSRLAEETRAVAPRTAGYDVVTLECRNRALRAGQGV